MASLSISSDNTPQNKIIGSQILITWVFLLLFPLEPVFFAKIPVIHNFFSIGKIIFDIYVLFVFVKGRHVKLGKFEFFIILYQLLLLGSTCINKTEIATQFMRSINCTCFVIILNYFFNCNAKRTIESLFIVFSWFVIINFFCLLIYPEGIETQTGRGVWFFGQANESTLYFIPTIAISLIRMNVNYKKNVKLSSFFIIIICILSSWLTGSVTSIIGLLLMLLICLLGKTIHLFINPIWGLILSGVVFFFFVIGHKQEEYGYLIEDNTERSADFSGRQQIWDLSIIYIIERPLIGYGLESKDVVQAKLFQDISTPHNKILHTLYLGGVPLLIAFIMSIISCCFALRKIKKTCFFYIISSSIIAFTIQMEFESYTLLPFWLPFIFASNSAVFLTVKN